MLNLSRPVLVVVVFVMLTGCSFEHDVYTSAITEIEVTHFIESKEATTFTYGPGTKQLRITRNWLEKNRSGWKPYFATVAVGDFLVSGEGFSLHIGHGIVVLNYQHHDNGYKQLSKHLVGGEFEYLSAQ